MSEVMWSPSAERIFKSEMTRFMDYLGEKRGVSFSSYPELHDYSTKEASSFWQDTAEFYEINFETPASEICGDYSFANYAWFEGAKLNFAQNLLDKGEDNSCALQAIHESGREQKISYIDLRKRSASFAGALKKVMGCGDVLAAYMPNIPETVISMLEELTLTLGYGCNIPSSSGHALYQIEIV